MLSLCHVVLPPPCKQQREQDSEALCLSLVVQHETSKQAADSRQTPCCMLQCFLCGATSCLVVHSAHLPPPPQSTATMVFLYSIPLVLLLLGLHLHWSAKPLGAYCCCTSTHHKCCCSCSRTSARADFTPHVNSTMHHIAACLSIQARKSLLHHLTYLQAWVPLLNVPHQELGRLVCCIWAIQVVCEGLSAWLWLLVLLHLIITPQLEAAPVWRGQAMAVQASTATAQWQQQRKTAQKQQQCSVTDDQSLSSSLEQLFCWASNNCAATQNETDHY